jgi:hypothetical protein
MTQEESEELILEVYRNAIRILVNEFDYKWDTLEGEISDVMEWG